jgi:mono/diheme cytochrome c family protein
MRIRAWSASGTILLACALAGSGLRAQNVPAPNAAPAAAAFAPGDGMDIVQARCAACHPATMITGKRFTAQKWGEVVDQMVSKGAQVSDEDYPVIVAYLAKTYGADK